MAGLAQMKIKGFFGDYRFLSNFWFVKVIFDEVEYRTVEHAYQAAKTIDLDIREIIEECIKPGLAKRRGKHIVVRPNWENIKLGIMKDLVFQKFHNNKELCYKLLATGSVELIEHNSWGDTFWGVCNGKGANNLGKILMEVRSELLKTKGDQNVSIF